MTLHRFFLPLASFKEGKVDFPPDAAHQIRRVLRLQPGDTIITLDNTGREYDTLLEIVDDSVEGKIVLARRNQAEPRTRVTLYQGVVRNAKFEMILQRCTEVGVSSFVPIQTQYSLGGDPGAGRQVRFDTIVREAAEQSKRGQIPMIGRTVALDDAFAEATAAGRAVLLWEEEKGLHLTDVVPEPDASELGLFVGPEGGFSAEEVQRAEEAGVIVATLGPRVLRAETAAIVGSALVLSRGAELTEVDTSPNGPL